MARHLIITGGTGYLGTALVACALEQGRAVTLLGRRAGPLGTQHRRWMLGEPLPAEIDTQDAALVHLAHDWRAGDYANVAGTALLFASAEAAGVASRVFVSSQSARNDALNRYGRMKWAAEQRIAGATSLRVGLIYGGPRVAMYGLLCRLASLPVLPMIEPARAVQPIHLGEVVAGMLAAVDGRGTGRVLALAGPDPVQFGDVLRLFARVLWAKRLPIVPIPLRFALWACELSARLPLVPTIDRERVLGLAGTEPIDSAVDLARLGIAVRPIAKRLAAEPACRRALLVEARALLRRAGTVPTSALMRRYARAFPDGAMVRSRLEPIDGPVAARMRAAARLAEASVAGEARLARGSRVGRLARLAVDSMAETLMLPVRIVVTRR